MKRIFSFVAVVTLLFTSLSVSAQDWTQWRGAGRDGKITAFKSPAAWPPGITLLWRDSVGTGDATPLLAGDKLYVFARQGGQEVILCLDAGSGEELWRDQYEAPAVTGAGARHPGPRSTPILSGGKIVTLGASGILSCLDAAGGKLLWRKDPFPGKVPMFFTSSSPMVEDGTCIAFLGSADEGALIAYDLNNGNEKWRWSEEGPDYGSPVLLTVEGTREIVTLTARSLVGIGLSDGKLHWKVPYAPERRAYNAATPIVDGNRVIITGAGRGASAIQIQKEGTGFSVKELWSNPDHSVQFNTPVLKDGMLYGYSSSGYLYCLDANNGGTLWADTVRHDRSGFASILDAGPVVLAMPASSELIVVKPGQTAYAELARIKVADLPVYAHPVVAGDRIFVRDERTVSLWKIR